MNFHTVNDSIWTPCIFIHLYTYSKKHDIIIDKLPIKFSSEKNPWFSCKFSQLFCVNMDAITFIYQFKNNFLFFLQISPFLSDLLWHIGITYHEKRQQNVDKDISYKKFSISGMKYMSYYIKNVAVFEFIIKDKSI